MTTVSRAVSGAGRVSPGVPEQVVAVSEKRRYWFNAVARSLRVGVTWVLGIPNEIYRFFTAVARTLEELSPGPDAPRNGRGGVRALWSRKLS